MTIQSPDTLIYQRKHFTLWSWPLESYFDKGNPRPDPGGLTNLNRGYRATWEIDQDTLYLTDIREAWVEGAPVGVAELFPGHEGRVEASWFTGELRTSIREGALDFNRSRYLILKIRDGKVVQSRVFEERRELQEP